MLINIFTLSMGRELYLRRLINSIIKDIAGERLRPFKIRHQIVFQGYTPSIALRAHIQMAQAFKPSNYTLHVMPLEENIGIAAAMNLVYPKLEGDLIIKMDDDAKIISSEFFETLVDVHSLIPHDVFSPYPVGLINNPGGPPKISHQVLQSKTFDSFYTLRKVDHVGGFCRVAPIKTKDWVFTPDLIQGMSGTEDTQHSAMCRANNINMYYLENSLVVEHQESTLGQHTRYTTYFKGRF